MTQASEMFEIPLVIRGAIIPGTLTHVGRRGGASFTTADVSLHLKALSLQRPSDIADLYAISFEEILDFLDRVGERLVLEDNPHLQAAFRLACHTSGLSPSILEHQYAGLHGLFRRDIVREMAELSIGIDYLDGWVEQPRRLGTPTCTRIRAFGARSVHVIAGNAPTIGAMTVIRNAFTRSDAIIKTPSNDPMTTAAIAITMAELDPIHPITRHLTVAYWKGGDETIESYLYDPRKIEKIIAWGGFASIQHISKYIQPGIDLVTLDPKHSATIIGREAFESEERMRETAGLLALDIGNLNQEACMNARVVYVESGTDAEGLARAGRLGELTFEAIQTLPEHLSTAHSAFDPLLREELEGLRYMGDEYRLIGGRGVEGGVIVSQQSDPVDFAHLLSGRVANLVPVDDVERAVRSTNAYTQTVGVYPASLKQKLRDLLAFQGAQRIVSLGGALPIIVRSGPHDGIEPVRRMCKWLTDETTMAPDLLAANGVRRQEQAVLT
jgi:Acyl-CoA reductase (LuxC)